MCYKWRTSLKPLPQGSPAWHQLRVCRITASDAPACTGSSECCNLAVMQQSKLAAYKQLLNGEAVTVACDNPNMAHGRQKEAHVADLWLQQLRFKDPHAKMLRTGLHVHPEHPYIAASPDRLAYAALGEGPQQQLFLLEVKTRPERPLPAELPEDDRHQVLTQLACVGKACQAMVVYWKDNQRPVPFVVR